LIGNVYNLGINPPQGKDMLTKDIRNSHNRKAHKGITLDRPKKIGGPVKSRGAMSRELLEEMGGLYLD
jgi:hypothetical protein